MAPSEAPEPTMAPTPDPTVAPSEAPTDSPSRAPTETTSAPTVNVLDLNDFMENNGMLASAGAGAGAGGDPGGVVDAEGGAMGVADAGGSGAVRR
eukprot:CAMPEP_0118923810 /NCGR_PEP_ID=MMETSP1169-20130426/2206_1 /TAXON_ID=36882 /ORGANISM="Pyramimonas obovata, Strain CCMP722" /LENGTH=94 /DNA_ID=CAMNT_0006864859 /DNA_START=265 /DNA_END=549 /DNA_ORIENTATION=+